jgi:hypothetical protein
MDPNGDWNVEIVFYENSTKKMAASAILLVSKSFNILL